MFDPLTVFETSVHPAGVVTTGTAFTSITAIITSPATVPGGLDTVTQFASLFAPVAAPRRAIPDAPPPPPPEGVTVQANVSAASTAAGPPSLTVTRSAYGLAAAAPVAIVPVICPDDVSIDRPGGSPVAAYVRGSWSASVACEESEITAPSASVRSGRS